MAYPRNARAVRRWPCCLRWECWGLLRSAARLGTGMWKFTRVYGERWTMDDGRWTMRIYHLKSCNTVLAIMDMVTVFDCGDGVLAIYVCGGLPQFPQFDLFPHP